MKKVLIVDDRAEIRKLVQMTLELGDYQFMEAADGVTALHIIRTSKPDVALLDIMMPGEIDGLDACRTAKSDPSVKSRIVLLTARGQQTDIEEGLKAGADAYLVKPFSPIELIDTVERLTREATA
jgi:DNA-binding response OmpR family regulator